MSVGTLGKSTLTVLENFKTVNTSVAFEILKLIADYPNDLFKIKIKAIVKELIDADLLKFIQFMEHRIRQPSILT